MGERFDTTIMTAVVVADPDHVELERIRAVLAREPDLEIVATTGRRDDAVDLLRELEPEVAVIDVRLLSFCDRPLHGWGPISQRVGLVAVGLGQDAYLESTLHAAGFAAYVSFGRLRAELAPAIRQAARHARPSASRSLTR